MGYQQQQRRQGGNDPAVAASPSSATQAIPTTTSLAASSPVVVVPPSPTPTTTTPVLVTSSTSSSRAGGSTAPSSSTGGIAPGAAVGIGIGGALAGAALTLLLGYLLLRQRLMSSSHRRKHRSKHPPPASATDKGAFDVVPAVTTTAGGTSWDPFLPQQADDDTVRHKVSTLFDQLDLHVDNFYRDTRVPITPDMERPLSTYGSPHVSEPVVRMLQSTTRPTSVIRHCLAYHVLRLTSTREIGARSLLPAEVTGLVRGMDQQSLPDADRNLAFARWRALTAYLRPDLLLSEPSSTTTSTNPSQVSAIQDAVQSFSTVFYPWSDPAHSQDERARHLVQVLHSAIANAMWLFSQPSSFLYDWTAGTRDVRERDRDRSNSRHVVVAPALLKVTDSHGQTLPRPQVVLPAVTKPL